MPAPGRWQLPSEVGSAPPQASLRLLAPLRVRSEGGRRNVIADHQQDRLCAEPVRRCPRRRHSTSANSRSQWPIATGHCRPRPRPGRSSRAAHQRLHAAGRSSAGDVGPHSDRDAGGQDSTVFVRHVADLQPQCRSRPDRLAGPPGHLLETVTQKEDQAGIATRPELPVHGEPPGHPSGTVGCVRGRRGAAESGCSTSITGHPARAGATATTPPAAAPPPAGPEPECLSSADEVVGQEPVLLVAHGRRGTGGPDGRLRRPESARRVLGRTRRRTGRTSPRGSGPSDRAAHTCHPRQHSRISNIRSMAPPTRARRRVED